MKAIKYIATAVVAISLVASCGLLSKNGSTQSTGTSTGSALSTIYSVLKSTGALDLGDLSTLINLGKILTGANSLVDASQSYVDQFASDLIKGSNNLVNSSNVSSVISSLKNLAGMDTSLLSKAATSAISGNLVPVSSSNSAVKAIESLVGSLK